jgi:hypothetical protein
VMWFFWVGVGTAGACCLGESAGWESICFSVSMRKCQWGSLHGEQREYDQGHAWRDNSRRCACKTSCSQSEEHAFGVSVAFID